jgi:NAD(P)-dependent dehydrogenase (short-subunit alcohol dehydrogenase family)
MNLGNVRLGRAGAAVITRALRDETTMHSYVARRIGVLTRYLSKELGPRRMTSNVVAPGPVQRDFSGGMVRDNPEVNKKRSWE